MSSEIEAVEDVDPVDAMAAQFEAQMDASDAAAFNQGAYRSPGEGGVQSDESIFEPQRDASGRFVSIDESTQSLHAVEGAPQAEHQEAIAPAERPAWEQKGQERVDRVLSGEIETLHEKLRQSEERHSQTQQWINTTFPTEQAYQSYTQQQQQWQQQPWMQPQQHQPQQQYQQQPQQQHQQQYQPQPQDPYADPDVVDAQRAAWQQNQQAQQMQQHINHQSQANEQMQQQVQAVQQQLAEQEDRYWLAQVEAEAQQATARYTQARPQAVLAMFAACKGTKSIAQCAREDHGFIQAEINKAISARASQGAAPTQVRGRETLESARSEVVPDGLIKGDFGDFERVANFTRKQFGVRR